MSKMIEINLKPDLRILRQFGWIALVGFGLLSLLSWQHWLIFRHIGAQGTTVALTLAGLGVLSAFFSLAWPKANLPLYVSLTLLSYPIGFVLSHLIMGLLFYGLLTPVALFFRLIGRDPMHRRLDPDSTSYWIDCRKDRPPESYLRQF